MKRSILNSAIFMMAFVVTSLSSWVPAEEKKPSEQPPVSDQPALAVLPFNHPNGTPESDYLTDLTTVNISDILQKIPALLVISGAAPNQGQAVSLPQLAKAWGVRYVLEGNVQKTGERVRITAKLSDAEKDQPLWSEEYERELSAIFDLHDKITRKVVSTLGVTLSPEEQARVWRRPTRSVEAYQALLQARERFLRFTKEDFTQAQQLAERAIALDPEFVRAYAQLGFIHYDTILYGWAEDPAAALARAADLAHKAMAIDDHNPYTLDLLSRIEAKQGHIEQALALSEKAIAFSPSNSNFVFGQGVLLNEYASKPAEALLLLQKAIRLSPGSYPAAYDEILGRAHYALGEYDKALALFEKYHQLNPKDTDGFVEVAFALAELGRLDEARAKVGELLKLDPKFTFANYTGSTSKNSAVVQRLRDNLRKAGLSE